jgi:hypothetical protein
MPVQPASLANLRPWNQATARLAALTRHSRECLIRNLILPDLTSTTSPEVVLVRNQLKKVRLQIAKTESPVTLERLIKAQSKLMAEERRLLGDQGKAKASTPARPAVKAKPTYLE